MLFLGLVFFILETPVTAWITARGGRYGGIQPLSAAPKIFIDGEAGTTGLQVRERLGDRKDIEVLQIPTELRKDDATRRQFINEADVVILCKSQKLMKH